MTLLPIARLRQHAFDLARAFDAQLVEMAAWKPEDAFAALKHRVVVIAPITDETLYAIALHELGHLADPLGAVVTELRPGDSALRVYRLRLEAEEAAWRWAQHHALDWSPAMDMIRAYGLRSYRADAPPEAAQPTTDRIDWSKWR